MEQLPRNSLIGLLSAAYIYSLLYLTVSVLKFFKSAITKTSKLCCRISNGFFDLITKVFKLVVGASCLILIAPVFATKTIHFLMKNALILVKKSSWICNKLKKASSLATIRKTTSSNANDSSMKSSSMIDKPSLNNFVSFHSSEEKELLIPNKSNINKGQTEIETATNERKTMKIPSQEYKEVLKNDSFVEVENVDATICEDVAEDFEYLCENSIAMNYLDQLKRLEDNKIYAEKLNQIKESCIPQKQVSRIPVWNGTTIRNKNDEEARLKYINADIQRSQIPRLCVDITKEHYYKEAYSLRYRRKVRTRAESPDPCCTFTGERDGVEYYHCYFGIPKLPRGRDRDFKYTAYHW